MYLVYHVSLELNSETRELSHQDGHCQDEINITTMCSVHVECPVSGRLLAGTASRPPFFDLRAKVRQSGSPIPYGSPLQKSLMGLIMCLSSGANTAERKAYRQQKTQNNIHVGVECRALAKRDGRATKSVIVCEQRTWESFPTRLRRSLPSWPLSYCQTDSHR